MPTGDGFSTLRRPVVLRALAAHLSISFCGNSWSSVEATFSKEDFWRQSERVLKRNPVELRAAQLLQKYRDTLTGMPCAGRVDHLASLLGSQFHLWTPRGCPPADPRNNRWLAELALRLTSCPETARAWAGQQILPGLRRLLELPALPRLARFLALMVHHNLPPHPLSAIEVLAGWRWQ